MRFCRLSVTSRSSRRRDRRIRRKARMRLSESSPSKRSPAVWLGRAVVTGLLIRVYRRGDHAPAVAESDPTEARSFTPAAENHLVAVLKEGARLAATQLEGVRAAAS